MVGAGGDFHGAAGLGRSDIGVIQPVHPADLVRGAVDADYCGADCGAEAGGGEGTVMQLSPHFTLAELTQSDTADRLGIDNTPSEGQIIALGKLAARLEDVRAITGPLQVTSGYRCNALNTAIGSKPTSQHVLCQAADLKSLAGLSALELCIKVKESSIHFDQLIFEFGSWMHISFTDFPRRSILTIDKNGTRPWIG